MTCKLWITDVVGVVRESERGSAPLSHVEKQILDSPALSSVFEGETK